MTAKSNPNISYFSVHFHRLLMDPLHLYIEHNSHFLILSSLLHEGQFLNETMQIFVSFEDLVLLLKAPFLHVTFSIMPKCIVITNSKSQFYAIGPFDCTSATLYIILNVNFVSPNM